MLRKRYTSEQIIGQVRHAEVGNLLPQMREGVEDLRQIPDGILPEYCFIDSELGVLSRLQGCDNYQRQKDEY
jgi:hypothetical protein